MAWRVPKVLTLIPVSYASRSGRPRPLHPGVSWLSNRGRTAWRGSAPEETLGAQVFIHVWPVDSETTPGDLPIVPLFRCRMKKPWIPGYRYRDRASVDQVNNQQVVGEPNVLDFFSRFRFRNPHSTPRQGSSRSSGRSSQSYPILWH